MKKATLHLFAFFLASFAATMVHGQAASVSTPTFSNITATSATATSSLTQGSLSNTILSRGVIFAKGKALTTPPPTATAVTATGTSAGTFTCRLTGLTQNTEYTVWAFVVYRTATNPSATARSGGKTLTTASLATVTTTAPSAITATTATSGGNVTAGGSSAVTARGVVWSTAQDPTVSLTTKTTNGTGTGAFTSNITGLLPSTTYHVRAYATNGAGTAYGAQQTFTTSAPPAPAALPDLQARPTHTSNVNRPLFRVSGGSFGANNETFQRVPDVFCAGLTGGTLVTSYPCGLNTTCREFKHSIALPQVIYSATNTGNTASGAFVVTLSRQTRVNGTLGSMVQVASSNVTGLNAGANAANFSFLPPGNVDVYRFPDDNPGLCFVRCDPNQGGCVLPFEENAYLVKVDGGNSAGAASQVAESNETNNEGNPMP